MESLILDFNTDRETWIRQVKAASPYLPTDFNESAAKVFGFAPATIAQIRKGDRFNEEIFQFIIVSALVRKLRNSGFKFTN